MQGPDFFEPHIAEVKENKIKIENTKKEVLKMKKGCQAVKIATVREVPDNEGFTPPPDLPTLSQELLPPEVLIKDIKFDQAGTLTKQER